MKTVTGVVQHVENRLFKRPLGLPPRRLAQFSIVSADRQRFPRAEQCGIDGDFKRALRMSAKDLHHVPDSSGGAAGHVKHLARLKGRCGQKEPVGPHHIPDVNKVPRQLQIAHHQPERPQPLLHFG